MADPSSAGLFHSMYEYSSSSALLPPPVLLTSTSWWDEQKIQETVTARYVRQALLTPSSRKRLHEQLQFGEGLTESTYVDWIVEHMRKFFLILVELNVPDMIFDIIDGSWDDEDLPLSLRTVERLRLPSAWVERKFAKKQYAYLVRELVPGEVTEYLDEEVIPLEVVSRRVQAAAGGSGKIGGAGFMEKVYFPRNREVYYSRRKVLLTHGEDGSSEDGSKMSVDSLRAEINRMDAVQHAHIVSIFAAYTQEGFGYVVLSPCIDLSLKSFIHSTPPNWKCHAKDKRARILFNWLHCLAEALAYLHEEGIEHGDIKPTSIIVEANTHKVYLAGIGTGFTKRSPASRNLAVADMEAYEYGAPELWQRTLTSQGPPTASPNTSFSGRSYQGGSTVSSSSDDGTASTSPTTTNIAVGRWSSTTPTHPFTSDTFSLACVFLDILTFKSKRKQSAFASHRSSKNRRPRESGPPDASFHANLKQVDTWISTLHKDARKRAVGDGKFVSDALDIVRGMLVRDPEGRPGARGVANGLYEVVWNVCRGSEMPCCGVNNILDNYPGAGFGGWGVEDFGHVLGDQDSRGGSRRDTGTTASWSPRGSRRWMAI